MIDIQWKGKIGYGDIISPICYAHNVSFKLQTHVKLTFRWEHGRLQKIHSSDPETLWGRSNYINSLCKKEGTSVEMVHSFENPLDINHTNYDWDVVGRDPYHNYWMPNQTHKTEHNTILVNSTMSNVMTLKQYGKAWKDPLEEMWNKVIDELSKRYVVRVVDYRTPIEKLMRLLQTSRGFFGYHGTAAWTAKFMHTPSIIFADGGSLTRGSFPYAHIEKTKDVLDSVLQNPEEYFIRSENRINNFRLAYPKYMPDQSFLDHLHHDV
jgi:hypothetical protein